MQVNDHDNDQEVLARLGQRDPWVMYLVLHASSSDPPTLGTALRLAARGCLALASSEIANEADHVSAFDAWHAESFRKVALRTRAKRWEQVSSLAGVEVNEAGFALRALVPIRKSERTRPVADAQAMTLKLPAPAGERLRRPGEALLLLNPNSQMSSGKAMAQVGHAALIMRDGLDRSMSDSWRQADWAVTIVAPSSSTWAKAAALSRSWGVRDAGLTEVDPGTLTVVATFGSELALTDADLVLA